MIAQSDIKTMDFKRKIITGAYSLLLPNVFEIMPEEYAKLKYHSSF
jgi:hypothetical protein